MMSSAAIASGGGVAAGSTVAILQSMGAAGAFGVGLSVLPVIAVGAGIAGIAFGIKKLFFSSNNNN